MIEEKLTHAHLKEFQQQTSTTTTTTTTRHEDDHQTSFKCNNPTQIQFNASATPIPLPPPPPTPPTTKRRTTTNHLLNLLRYSYNEENKSLRNRLESHIHHTTTTTTNARHLKHNQGVEEKEKRQELQALQGNHHRQQEAAFTCFNATTSCTNNLNVYKYNNNNNTHNTKVLSTTTPTPTTSISSTTMTSGSSNSSSSSSSNMQWPWRTNSVLGGLLRPRPPSSSSCSTSASLYFTLLILTTTCSLCSAGSLCESQSWWDPYKDKCIPCTVCQGDMIPLRPCQMHRDTVCGSIYDLKIDWVVLSKTEPNWKERRKFDGLDYGLDHHQLTAEQLQQLQDETDPMDWQTAALFLAVLACLLFFIVAACILVHHMRQWRRMERRLDQDVEELSTKLMAKLAEVQSLEGGTFFIGNADALRIPTTTTMTTAAAAFHQPQNVMLPEKSDKNHHHHHHHQQNLQHDRRLFNTNLTTLKSGNVYIEENSSKC